MAARRPGLVRRAAGKPPRVIALRALQEARIRALHLSGGWRRLERRAGSFWNDAAAKAYAERDAARLLVAADAVAAQQDLIAADPARGERIVKAGARARRQDIELLGSSPPRDNPWRWHRDWRFDHAWKPAFFRSYDLHAPRAAPWDVKYPWELSRLGFLQAWLQPLAHAAGPDPEGASPGAEAAAEAAGLLRAWERDNPLAYSVNWYPMEASMRALNLLIALEMALACGVREPDVLRPFLRQLAVHGHFVWRTREYTDVRGNHYAANVAALALLGAALAPAYGPARRWRDFGAAELEREVTLQFHADGVNFEQSVPYHALVAELFLLALIGLERAGLRSTEATRRRLQDAFDYLAACRRPDGRWPLVGDNDNARVLQLDGEKTGRFDALCAVAAAYFERPTCNAAPTVPDAAAWILGRDGVSRCREATPVREDARSFAHGGVVVARRDGNYLWMDVGGVGLAGRGGHGHNDIGSFELAIDGRALVIDPGCPVYSGDPELCRLFKSTAYHNGLRVDGEEIAPIRGLFRIGDDARPDAVSVELGPDEVEVDVTHHGYRRLPDPVSHRRRVRFEPDSGALDCEDELSCSGPHAVERFLHFADGVEVTVQGDRAILATGGQPRAHVYWEEDAAAAVEDGLVSPGYGQTLPARILVLRQSIEGSVTLSLRIHALAGS